MAEVGPTPRSLLSNSEFDTISQIRRSFPRYGAGVLLMITPDNEDVDVPGVTLNVSRSGMLAVVPHSLEEGQRCLIEFLERYKPEHEGIEPRHRARPRADLIIPPQSVWGHVLRIGEGSNAQNVAFRFDTRLEIDREPDTQTRKRA